MAALGGTSTATELLGVTERLWCAECKMHCAVRATFTLEDHVGHVDWCPRCHGGNVGS